MGIKFGGLPSKYVDESSLLFAFLVMQSYKLGTSTNINIDEI